MEAGGDLECFELERDGIALIALLAFSFYRWDTPVRVGEGVNDVNHQRGYNLAALMIDEMSGRLLSIASNEIHRTGDATRHAEWIAIRRAVRNRRRHEDDPNRNLAAHQEVLTRTIMYSTLEPCPMCSSAICLARIPCSTYSLRDPRFAKRDSAGAEVRGGEVIGDLFYPLNRPIFRGVQLKGESRFMERAMMLWRRVLDRVEGEDNAGGSLRMRGVRPALYLDHMYDLLEDSARLLEDLEPQDLALNSKRSNQRLLFDLKYVMSRFEGREKCGR